MGGKSDARITDFCLVRHTLSMIRNIIPVLLLEKSFESNYVLRNSGFLFGYQNNDSIFNFRHKVLQTFDSCLPG